MPEAVIFDLDGTLYRQEPLRRAMLIRLARAHAFRPLKGLRTARVLGAYRRAQEHLRDSAIVSEDLAGAQLRLACESGNADPAFVTECVARWMEQDPLEILHRHIQPGLVDFLQECKQRGLRLGLFSDYPADAKLTALGLDGLFDVVLTAQSPGVGAFKPDPRGLLLVAERLGVSPDLCVYVGDRAAVDAAAAHSAGMASFILAKRAKHNEHWTAVSGYAELHERLFLAMPSQPPAAAQPSLDRR